jgi:Kelch motif
MTQALQPGVPRRRRALFGLLDADGWGWASVKAFFWFIVIIFLLGYVPDRAYYFTVNKTIDLGILAWSPVNLCPPSNKTLPCPAPGGSVIPWQPSPSEIALPQPRTDGALVVTGTKLLYIGGTDGTKATADVFVAETVQIGSFDKWMPGPPLPAPRANAAVTTFGGAIYVSGGVDEKGAPTKTTYVLNPNLSTGELGKWKAAADLKQSLDLPEARTAGTLVALADGLLFAGGEGPNGVTNTTWKSKLANNVLGEWAPQAPLAAPVADTSSALVGNFVWVYGGRDAKGPVGGVQRGTVATSGDQQGQVVQWGTNSAQNLPGPRSNPVGFLSNGTIYLVGGNDGSVTRGEVYWTVPFAGADGDQLAEWKHLAVDDLPAPGLEGGSAAVSGATVFITGGKRGGDVVRDSVRADLAPQEPFFQLGLVGATVPALKIDGELGQQLGYLNAAGAGTATFILLLLIGWAYAHKEQTRAMFERMRRRRVR